MIYRQFGDKKLSALGFGCMRLPVKAGVYSQIDEPAAAEMIDYAIKSGVNYFDTAWGYHDGQSEIVMGRILSKYPRESFYLASKFPGYDLANMDKVEEIFEKQLEKCFLDKYGDYMEFGQLQINYLDWKFQNAKEKVELLTSRNIPVWVMEPLRGGKLAALDADDEKTLKALRPDEGVPAWAFRFLQSLPQVTMILSGMSDMAQTKDNMATFATDKPLDAAETAALMGIADDMIKKSALPCTECRYCTSHCAKGLDIPALIKLYNEHRFTGGGFIAPMVLGTFAEDKRPAACVGCRSCEAVCPQSIRISEMMKDFCARLK